MINAPNSDLFFSCKHGRMINYWQVLSLEYNLPVELIKLLYDEWDTKEYANFGDYIRARVNDTT